MTILPCISLIVLYINYVGAVPCPSMCNGHGRCEDVTRICDCFEGYQSGDCSELICPFGPAWTDQAIAVDIAHNDAECSNMGLCDRSTGTCQCREGFEGKACERKSCPNDCSGNGRCQSMMYYAQTKNPGEGIVYAYDGIWDAEMIYGCHCDTGYYGPDCSLRYCPRGDDPLTGNLADTSKNPRQYNEVQKVACKAGSGYFTLSFRDKTTARIPYNAKAADIERYLENLVSIGDVKIVMFQSPGQACTDAGNTWTVEFRTEFGDVPMLVADASGLSFGDAVYTVTLTVGEQLKGTKESEECSNRGICDADDGYCYCEPGYDTSDGYDAKGKRGDCGRVLTTIQQCPGILSCSGHGVCSDSPSFRCQCAEGWVGADCSNRVCPKGTSWFTYPEADNLAHVYEAVECSDMGICNRDTGECECMDGFTGSSCNRLTCPTDTPPTPCNGHGQCYDMATLAELAEINGDAADITYGMTPNKPSTWDAERMFGCYCDEGWTGFDCSLRVCPFGDDPNSFHQNDEIQSIRCTDADGDGTIVLTFRQEDATPLSPLTTTAELAAALNALDGIREVSVVLFDDTKDDQLCTAAGNTFLVQFLTEHGDLPIIGSAVEDVDDFLIEEYTKGTKENWECSGKGLCDRGSGECLCFNGFGSSDGKGNKGVLGDCGYIEPIVGGNYKEDVSSLA